MKLTHVILPHLMKDEVLSKILEQVTIEIHEQNKSIYETLTKSILSQQLSTTAAATIYGRFLKLIDQKVILPEMVLTQNIESLRSVGLSHAKAQYVLNVADYFRENDTTNQFWHTLSDDLVIQKLTTIKGVGKWTVEMLLIFGMNREDVLPLDDLIIKNTMLSLYGISPKDKNAVQYLKEVADNWRPFRSYACRYLWAGKNLILAKNF